MPQSRVRPQRKVGGLGHALNQSAHLFHIARVRRVQNGAGAHKEQTFECRVIERVKQRGYKRQRRQAQIIVFETTCRANAEQNDADVFDTGVRQQALEIGSTKAYSTPRTPKRQRP